MPNNNNKKTEQDDAGEDGKDLTNIEKYNLQQKQKQLKQEKEKLQKERSSYLEDNNKLLMKGTKFDESFFDGMSPHETNKFLKNYHKKQEDNESEPEPNDPIIGNPTGSGRTMGKLDEYLDINPQAQSISFSAPASEVFGKHNNKKEAKEQWLGVH
jgi:hypothetical protein